MPVNSRYLGNTYSSSSSLYKKAQAAQKKVQSLEDTEMKYLWDTNQIDNNAYFDYASTRFNEVTDQIDKQTWDRTIRSVNKEIVSDYKNAAFYEISKTPGNTSGDIYSKVEMYNNVSQLCKENGDEDGALQATTAMNNAYDSYLNKLESETKVGNSAAKKALNENLSDIKMNLNMKLNEVNDPTNMVYKNNPGLKALTEATIKANLAQVNSWHASSVYQYDTDAALSSMDKAQDAYNTAIKLLEPYNVDMGALETSISDFSTLGKIDIPVNANYNAAGQMVPELNPEFHYEVDKENGGTKIVHGSTDGLIAVQDGNTVYFGRPEGTEQTKVGEKYYNAATNSWTDYKPTTEGVYAKETMMVDKDNHLRMVEFAEGSPTPVLGAYIDPRDFYDAIKEPINNLRLSWYKQNGILPETATIKDVYTVPSDKRLNYDWNNRKFIQPTNPLFAKSSVPGLSGPMTEKDAAIMGGLSNDYTTKTMEKINEKIWNEAGTAAKIYNSITNTIGNKPGAISPVKTITNEIMKTKTGKAIAGAAAPTVSKVVEKVAPALTGAGTKAVAPIKKAISGYVENASYAFKPPAPIQSVYGDKSYGEFLGKGANGLAYFKKTKGVNSYDYFSSAYGSKVYNPTTNTEAQKYTGKS